MGTGPREPVGSSHSLMAAGDVRGIEDEPTLIGHSSSAAVGGRCSHAPRRPKELAGAIFTAPRPAIAAPS
jgi:hypothetical protein